MENVKLILEESYDIKILEIEKIKNVYKLNTTEGLKCFKVSRYKEYLVEFILNSIEHVKSRGYGGVLEPILSKSGDRYIQFEKGYGYLCEWIPSREADYKNPVDLKLCVKSLSKFHLSSWDFDPSKAAVGRRYYGKWITKFSKRLKEMHEFKRIAECRLNQSDFDKMYIEGFNSHLERAEKSIKALKSGDYRDTMERHRVFSGLCHHDTANHNFLIDDELSVYLIDFDYCITDSHLHDLASIAIRNLKYGNWSLDTLSFIISAYRENIEVTSQEMSIIKDFIEFPQDYWQVGLQYYIEHQPWDEEFFNKKLSKSLEDSSLKYKFLDEAHKDFINV
ncbi:CotS family spore coat protein [Clostridium cylindrosporum]|uniref:Spore coat protein, CotS family n=1 Tax=Clostridium cylindrosporum DSM 605 TaxID=1121307 RepID=A0A0J8DF82_CLOCY|nr:CotS family spore coat protein [Clostridium cylindrosporum]KMT22833.1 spore coat protein, CotS family [Clostridium cylindrosporum DSM 605]